MAETTTIEIRNDQQEELRDMKQHDRESYKAVLDRLLEGDTDTEPMQVVPVDEVVGRGVPQSSVEQDRDFDDWFSPDHAKTVAEHIRLELEQTNTVQLEATEYTKIADELEGRLR